MKIRHITSGLQFPEGPIAMDDGSVLLVEIARGTLSRVTPDGRIHVVSQMGGGPNGAAIGPDGAVYVCNNGGFEYTTEVDGCFRPIAQARDYAGGRIERVNLATGKFERLFDAVDGVGLRGPNDIVFDARAASTSPTWARCGPTRWTTAACSMRPAMAARRAPSRARRSRPTAWRCRRTAARCTTPRPPARGFGPSTSLRRARCARTRGRRRTAGAWWWPRRAGSSSASTRWPSMPTATCTWPR